MLAMAVTIPILLMEILLPLPTRLGSHPGRLLLTRSLRHQPVSEGVLGCIMGFAFVHGILKLYLRSL